MSAQGERPIDPAAAALRDLMRIFRRRDLMTAADGAVVVRFASVSEAREFEDALHAAEVTFR